MVKLQYVDDINLTCDDHAELIRLKKILSDAFEIKELGPLRYFLGIEFAKSKEAGSLTNENTLLIC